MRYRNRLICCVCCLVLGLSGCGSTPKEAEPSETAVQEVSTQTETESENLVKLRQAGSGTPASKKEEMVQAKAKADGTVYETTVKTTLTPDNEGPVADLSTAKELKNTEGGEEFIEISNGEYLWENLGADIQYEGIGETELPISVKFSYQLDGQDIQPEELAGKSGHLKIRVDYENHETREITVEDEKVETVVPFTAVTAVMLDQEKCANIQITNGELSRMSDMQLVIGYAMPGVKEALDVDGLNMDAFDDLENLGEDQDEDKEKSESEAKDSQSDAEARDAKNDKKEEDKEDDEFEIPNYMEIEADVTDFSLEFTATLITPGMLSDLSTDKFKDLESALGGMTDLGEASDEIQDGFDELGDGVNTLSKNFGTYNDGVSGLHDGAVTLQSGMKKILAAGGDLEKGASGIASGLKQLEASLAAASEGSGLDLSGLQSMQGSLESIGTDVANLMTVAAQMQTASEAVVSYENAVEEYQSSVKNRAESARSRLDGIDLSQVPEEQREVLEGAISDARGELNEILGASLPAKPELSVDLQLLETASSDLATQVNTLSAAAEGLKAALSGLEGLSSQTEQLKSGVSTLRKYADQMDSGVKQYNDALDQLYKEGIVAMADGTGKLASAGDAFESGLKELKKAVGEFSDGYKEFDEEGIQKLAALGDTDAKLLLRRIRALKEADSSYDNFAGKYEGQESSVTFLIETDSIG